MKIDKTLKITIGIILIALTTTAFIIDLKFGKGKYFNFSRRVSKALDGCKW